MNIYVENGYLNRRDYLSTDAVFGMAAMLGPSEDFDGLICELEDMEGAF